MVRWMVEPTVATLDHKLAALSEPTMVVPRARWTAVQRVRTSVVDSVAVWAARMAVRLDTERVVATVESTVVLTVALTVPQWGRRMVASMVQR